MYSFLQRLGQFVDTVFTWPYARYARANFSKGHCSTIHCSFYFSLILAILFGLSIRLMNYFFWNFEAQRGVSWLPHLFLFTMLLFYLFLAFSIERRFPRTALLGSTLLWILVLFEVQIFVCASIMETPFRLIDHNLISIDQLMHINLVDIVVWAHQHTYWIKCLQWSYETWACQMVLIALILACAQQRRLLIFYFAALQWLFFIGYIIYFFMPTIGPAAIFQQAYFPHGERMLASFFYKIHHHIKHVLMPASGFISFPSYHAIGALLVTLVAIKGLPLHRFWAKCFLSLLIILNTLLLFSTVFLGHHYLIDVIAAFIMVLPVGYWLYFYDSSY